MKCDELKVYVPQDGPYGLEPEEGGKLVEEETCYLKSDVDAAFEELKEKIHALEKSYPKALCLYHKCGFNVGTLEGRADNCEFYWRVYMETKPGLKGHEAETMEYEYPPKKVVYDG